MELQQRRRAVAEWLASPIGDNASAARLLEAWHVVLAGVEVSAWPELAWRFSRLTPDGCPVEVTFSSSDDVARFTAEVAGPEVGEGSRLEAGLDCLRSLGLPLPDEADRAHWRELQAGERLRWGTWMGVRCGRPEDGAGCQIGAKLYVEMPRGGLAERHGTLTPGSRLHMIGHEAGAGPKERYFRVDAVDDIEHRALLRSFCEQPHWAALMQAVAELCEEPGECVLRWRRFGYSLAAHDGDSERPRLTLYFRSHAVGSASRVRRAFLRAAGENGSRSYRALFARMPARDLPDHGVIALTANADGTVEMRVGISANAVAECMYPAVCIQAVSRLKMTMRPHRK